MNKFLLAAISLALAPSFALAKARPWRAATDCRANIRAVTCRVAAQTEAEERNFRIERKCLGGEKPYADELVLVYDEVPPKVQKMFCHLRRIYIEEDFYATAYASRFKEIFRNKNGEELLRINGNVLGLSKQKLFESKWSLGEWLNRKEQTLFGRRMEDPLSAQIPQFMQDYIGGKARPQLIDTIVHEFGHLLEGSNNLMTRRWPEDEDPKCRTAENSGSPECQPETGGLWHSISWMPNGDIKPEDRYFGSYQPCYYGYKCGAYNPPPLIKARELYRGFVDGNAFVSTYASVDSGEDFAESFLFYISDNHFTTGKLDGKYFFSALQFAGEEPINLNSRSKGHILAKMNYMAMFDAMPWKYELGKESYALPEAVKNPALMRKSCF